MNKLTIGADSKEELDKVRETIKSDKSALSFETICPTPPELMDTSHMPKGGVENAMKRVVGVCNGTFKDYKDWYEFHLGEWGCKWDIDDPQVTEVTDKEIQLDFDTAWSPPISIIDKLEERFPDASFSLMYFEPGCCFAGEYGGGAEFQYSDGEEGYNEFASENFGWDVDDDEE
jgi:hypothetical protein